MKNIFAICFSLLIFYSGYAQNYDLIVTTKNDSLACHIDSITNTCIYFEMRYNYNWVSTMMKKEQIAEFKKEAIDMKYYKFKEGSSYIESRKSKYIGGYQHAHRLMFAPTSYSLEKGDIYYTTHYGLIHSMQFGLSDNISFDVGTSIMAIPLYAMLNFSFPINDNMAFTLGDLVIFDIWLESGVWGNLAYGMLSVGKKEKNINFGLGFFSLSENFTEKTNSPAITVSGQIKIGDRTWFVSEFYGTGLNAEHWIEHDLRINDQEYIYKQLFIGGMTGFRFTGKRNPRIAWQLGLAPILLIDQKEIPEIYNIPSIENHLEDGRVMLRGAPILSFSFKFGKNYK